MASSHSKPGSLPEPVDVDASSVISGEQLTIIPTPGHLASPTEHRHAHGLVLEPALLHAFALANEEVLIDTGMENQVVAIAVGVRAADPLRNESEPSAHWIIWGNAGYAQCQFAYNLAVETGAEVWIRPASAAPHDYRLDLRRNALGSLQPGSPSSQPQPLTFASQKPARGSRPSSRRSHRNDENERPPENIAPSPQGGRAPQNSGLPAGAQAPDPPSRFSRSPTPLPEHSIRSRPVLTTPAMALGSPPPGARASLGNFILPPGAQAPNPRPSALIYNAPIVMAPLSEPSRPPLENQAISVDPDAIKESRLNFFNKGQLFASATLGIQRGRRDQLPRQKITIPLSAQLSFARPQVDLAGGYLTVQSNGLPHTVTMKCENPIPLGTPKKITKRSDTSSVAGTAGLGATGVNVSATATVAKGAEHTIENQLPASTPYVSRVSHSTIIGQTVEIIPFDNKLCPPDISVNIQVEVKLADPTRRGPGYELALTFTGQWHLRQCAERRQIGFYSVLIFQVTEEVWGGNWEGATSTESVVEWADEPTRRTVTGLGFPTMTQHGETGPSLVLGLRSRLMPDQQRWFPGLEALLRRLRGKPSVSSRQLTAGAYKMWGKRGWIDVRVGTVLELPLQDSLYPDGAFVLDMLQVHPPLRFEDLDTQ
ncbi:hypothetical protein B0H11DRAFT_2107980 [Mycena galericulata]|nr:hypothetical protein B0H11DRAFT_2107980 [Mycena galericulata]